MFWLVRGHRWGRSSAGFHQTKRSQGALKTPRPSWTPSPVSLCSRGHPVSRVPSRGAVSVLPSLHCHWFTNKISPSETEKKRSYIFYNKYLPQCNGFITVILNEFITTVNVTSFYVSHVKYLDTHLYEQKLLGASVIFKCREGAGITVQWIKLLLAEPSISCLNSSSSPNCCVSVPLHSNVLGETGENGPSV